MSVQNETVEKVISTQKTNFKKPVQYKVIFHNDNFTPFIFVEKILRALFQKTKEEAQALALKIHKENKAVVAIYPKEIALTKKHLVDYNAKENKCPLLCEIEPDDNN